MSRRPRKHRNRAGSDAGAEFVGAKLVEMHDGERVQACRLRETEAWLLLTIGAIFGAGAAAVAILALRGVLS